MTSLITFMCYDCGLIYIVRIKDGNFTFSCMDKLYSSADVLTNAGYFVCVHCKKRTKIRFEKVY